MRREIYPLNLSDEEKQMLKQLAREQGMPMSVFLRYIIRQLAIYGSVSIKR